MSIICLCSTLMHLQLPGLSVWYALLALPVASVVAVVQRRSRTFLGANVHRSPPPFMAKTVVILRHSMII
ncbi:hypothetical protein OE88DRAFT_395470 [Heliocybe sulcata]|uniref:Uncharacterized protein n=1 Tax=Heliocybe sulcata TaxID=5364 RepID=A0A5C3MWD5_9AGAM|nr:hypothetical protein OE88DRAFT_395470 [Heliocybe sulcata]